MFTIERISPPVRMSLHVHSYRGLRNEDRNVPEPLHLDSSRTLREPRKRMRGEQNDADERTSRQHGQTGRLLR